MILINLLPHREAARKRRREMFYASLGASAAAGFAIAGVIWLWYGAQIANQESRNQVLTSEIKKLESQIKDIASLQEEIAALRARQQAVEDLQADRNMPVHLLNELSRLLPEGVYLSSMKQTNDTVALTGIAQSNERVSELLRNLGGGSPWLTRPELVEIVAGGVTVGKDNRRVSNFKMNVKMLRASEAQKAASAAASAAVGAASAAVVSAPPVARSAAVPGAAPAAVAPSPAPAAVPPSPAPAAVAAASPASAVRK